MSSELVERVDGIVHEATQVTERGLDLTVDEIYRLRRPGRVDFGGGELEPAEVEPHERVWRDEDDDYQWWHLEEGQYLLEHNESLATDEPVTVQPREAILERGATHPTLTTTSLPRLPLSVGGGGIRLKENARVSTVVEE